MRAAGEVSPQCLLTHAASRGRAQQVAALLACFQKHRQHAFADYSLCDPCGRPVTRRRGRNVCIREIETLEPLYSGTYSCLRPLSSHLDRSHDGVPPQAALGAAEAHRRPWSPPMHAHCKNLSIRAGLGHTDRSTGRHAAALQALRSQHLHDRPPVKVSPPCSRRRAWQRSSSPPVCSRTLLFCSF